MDTWVGIDVVEGDESVADSLNGRALQVAVVIARITFRSASPDRFNRELRSEMAAQLATAAGVPSERVLVLPVDDSAVSSNGVVVRAMVLFHVGTQSVQEALFIQQVTTSASTIFSDVSKLAEFEVLNQTTVTRSETTYGAYLTWPAVVEAGEEEAQSGCPAARPAIMLLVFTLWLLLL